MSDQRHSERATCKIGKCSANIQHIALFFRNSHHMLINGRINPNFASGSCYPDLNHAFRAGLSRAEAAARFQVNESSVQRWARLKRQTGSAAAKPMGGKRPLLLQ